MDRRGVLRVRHGGRLAGFADADATPTRRARSTPHLGWCPGFYGVVIFLLSIWLGVRAVRQGALQRRRPATASAAERHAAISSAPRACGGALPPLLRRPARPLPFWLASAIFVAPSPSSSSGRQARRGRALGGSATAVLLGSPPASPSRWCSRRSSTCGCPEVEIACSIAWASSASPSVGFMTPHTLFNVLWATFLGIVIGALPGLTATMGVALLTTLTFTMPHTEAIMVLICIYVGAIYGGSRSAILLNIPGTPASAASTLDGYPLARQGLAGRAMGISTSGSWLGTLFGILCLALLTPVLSELALDVPEFRVLLDRRVRRRGRRHPGGRRPAEGLYRRLPRPLDRHHRPGALLQLSALCLRLHRSGRRHRPAAGAGRRLRRRRGPAGHARARRQSRLQQASTRSCRASKTC